MNYDTYLKSGRLTRGVNHAPCWPVGCLVASAALRRVVSDASLSLFLFAQLLLLFLLLLLLVSLTRTLSLSHSQCPASVIIKLFVINELSFSPDFYLLSHSTH